MGCSSFMSHAFRCREGELSALWSVGSIPNNRSTQPRIGLESNFSSDRLPFADRRKAHPRQSHVLAARRLKVLVATLTSRLIPGLPCPSAVDRGGVRRASFSGSATRALRVDQLRDSWARTRRHKRRGVRQQRDPHESAVDLGRELSFAGFSRTRAQSCASSTRHLANSPARHREKDRP